MSDLNANPDDLNRLASQIQQQVEEIRNEITSALGSVTGLKDQWRDVRYEQFAVQVNEGFEFLRQVVDTLDDMSMFLRQRAQVLDDYLNGN